MGLTVDCRKNLRRAFDYIYDNHPFLSNTVSSWEVTFSEQFETAATNGHKLSLNPQFFGKLTGPEAGFLILHEAGHIFCGHHLRMEGRDPATWNIACDLALNSYLWNYIPQHRPTMGNNFYRPEWPPYDNLDRGMSAEWYYDKILQEQQSDKEDDGDQEGDSGEGETSGVGGESNKAADSPHSSLPQPNGGSTPLESTPDSSSGPDTPDSRTGGNSSNESPQSSFKNALGEFSSPLENPDDAEELEGLIEEWQERARNDAESAQSSQPGSVPGWALEEARIVFQSPKKTDWRTLLRRFVQETARTRWSFDRPHRRSAYRRDLIMPTRHSKTTFDGVMIVDTSGSMNPADCDRALTELQAIFEAYPEATVTLLQCDTRFIPESELKLTRSDFPLRVPPKWWGRGGTNLSPAMEHVAENKAKKNWKYIMVLTDMEWDVAGCKDAGLPTMWLATKKNWNTQSSYVPKFGHVVEMSE